jgi:hypothetical protein
MVETRKEVPVLSPITPCPSLARLLSLIVLIFAYLSAFTLLIENHSQPTMAATVQDVIMLLGDSITQKGWEPNAFAQRLACQRNLLCQVAFLG